MDNLTTIITILIVTLLIRYLFSLTKKKASTAADGSIELKYPGFMAVIGYIVIAFGALIGIVTVFQLIPTTGDEVVPYLVSFFVLLGLPLILLENRIRVRVNDQEIRYTGLIKQRLIRWNEAVKVTFSFTSEIVIHSDKTKIKLNVILEGFDSFIEFMKRKLKPELYEKALEKCEKVLNNMQGQSLK